MADNPLPSDGRNLTWPPTEHADRYRRMKVWAAWYSGDPIRLASVYGGTAATEGVTGGPATTINPTGRIRSGVARAVSRFLWGTPPAPGENDQRRHLPTAEDIAVVSSELLFADPPKFEVVGDEGEATTKAQERLDELLAAINFPSLLLAAAETQAALGSVGLRIAWDKSVNDRNPTIQRIDADGIVPTYRLGELVAVTFWKVVRNDGSGVWRHLEAHAAGRVFHGLYQGEGDRLGMPMPLPEHPSTRDLVVDEDGALPLVLPEVAGVTPRTAISVPNRLPDSHDRAAQVGASDYTDAVLDLLDAGDKAWTDLLLSIDDARSRIIIAADLLTSRGAGKGLEFNMAQRMFQRVNMPPAEKEGGSTLPIEKVQFDMRVAEYWQAIQSIYERTVQAAGYNPQTMGVDGEVAATATEYAGRSKRSMTTRDKKIRYWRPMLESLLSALLAVDAAEFGSGITPLPVRVSFPEAVQPSMDELLAQAEGMKRAGVATLRTMVAHVHPDWDESQVSDEVDELIAEAERRTPVDPLSFGLGGSLGRRGGV